LALAALEIGPGDEVIVPTFTIISCVAAIVRCGATPVLVDSDPLIWNMLPEEVERKITSRTKAIMVVHIYGLPCDMDPLLQISRRHSLYIIEDCAEILGQKYKERLCGTFGDIATFSFYANKHITTGEGGMVACNDNTLAAKVASFRNLCFNSERRFRHEELGWNYRLTSLQAAVGLAQLEQLDETIRKKREVGRVYDSAFQDMKEIILSPAQTEYADNIYWVYGILLSDKVAMDATEFIALLAEYGIESRPFFWCMHEQPVFKRMKLFRGESHPQAEKLARRGLYLPSGAAITEEEVRCVIETVKKILKA